MERAGIAAGLAFFTCASVWAAAGQADPKIQFENVTVPAGIAFQHVKGGSGRHYYPEQFGAGAALLDYNNDGFLDVFLVQGAPLPGFDGPVPTGDKLFRNSGNGSFTDVTNAAGLDRPHYGLGVASADYDNNGFPDLFVTTLQGNVLFRNDGRGRFVDVTRAAGVSAPALSTGAAFLDFDNDGWLDLFVARYTDYSLDKDLRCIDAASVKNPVLFAEPRTAPLPPDATLKLAYCGPPILPGAASRLYRNTRNGTFTDVTERSGVGKSVSHGLGVAVADFNEDGNFDIFVASDMMPNLLFMNAGNGVFREQALQAGVALGSSGKAFAGMGVDAADYDNDGHQDLFITNYEDQPSSLYGGGGNGLFDDRSVSSGIAGLSRRFLKWGARFVDLDLDGWLDLLVVNGHVDDNLGNGSPPRPLPVSPPNRRARGGAPLFAIPRLMIPGREGYPQQAQIYRGGSEGRFEDASLTAGDYFLEKHVGRGAAFGDFDNDGDSDVVIVNNDEPAALLRNDTARANSWVRLHLQGHGCNRDGIGARVQVRAGPLVRTQFVPTAGSYLSESDRRLLFAMPGNLASATAEVRWPCGATETISVTPGASVRVDEKNCRLRQKPVR